MPQIADNPLGTDGFEFVEYAAPDPKLLRSLFEQMGFVESARHRHKDVTLHSQGDINFIINAEPDSFAQQFARQHGPCVCAMAFRVKNASDAYRLAVARGATPIENAPGPMELNIPTLAGIGGSRIYLVDRYGDNTIYDVDFIASGRHAAFDAGLTYIDHLTHNVYRGHMNDWARFYGQVFNFQQVRYFDIEGKRTGLFSRAMTSPCGKIRIPINESADDSSQVEEYLREYRGEGIQHIALGSDDIYRTVEVLRQHQVRFQDTPDTYYQKLDKRVPEHGESLQRMQKLKVLLDGAPTEGQGLLLQIFTQNVIGPVFFEIIQRKGNEGFGEGNFQALFESIEADQIQRGVI